ncbi:MAG: hypothetical protein GX557_03820 [Chloroflexi bacterium]|nr:hypothetical protein [Chloroflexota bacterium]
MSKMGLERDRGAVIVQVAIMLVVLLLFVGLAVDVGAMYGQRRHMQNAADAGALAGAHAVCFGGDPIAKATEYAVTRNLAASAVVEMVNAYTVRVQASITTPLRFAGLIGMPTATVTADATAACGRANSACGLWPIAMGVEVWNANCNTEYAVWDDDKIDCTLYDCDTNDDGVDDIIAGGARGWLDFSSVDIEAPYSDACSGGGAALLKCYLEADFAAKISLPTCICSKQGVTASAWKTAGDQAGRDVIIPLFDSINTCTAGCGGGIMTYHIVDFGCAHVIGSETREVVNIATGKKTKSKVLIMRIDCPCASNCGGTSGGGGGPQYVKAVSLVD